MFLPYTLDGKYGEGRECESRLLTEWGTANEGGEDATCESERDWPELLGVLSLSVPVAVGGNALWASGSAGNRLSEPRRRSPGSWRRSGLRRARPDRAAPG